jgi:hypothetical protein
MLGGGDEWKAGHSERLLINSAFPADFGNRTVLRRSLVWSAVTAVNTRPPLGYREAADGRGM